MTPSPGPGESPHPALLSRRQIEDAFKKLDDRLRRLEVVADVHVIGGAAMVLEFNARPATRDVDAIWHPHGAVHDAAVAVARETGLPDYWLNEQASSYIPRDPEWGTSPVIDLPNLRVFTSAPTMALAMKARAARDADRGDIERLVDHLALETPAEVFAVVDRFFPGEPVGDRSRAVVADIFELRQA